MSMNEADTRYHLIAPVLRDKGYVSRDRVTLETVLTPAPVEASIDSATFTRKEILAAVVRTGAKNSNGCALYHASGLSPTNGSRARVPVMSRCN